MDLQDALKACGWSVPTAMEKIRNDARNVMSAGGQKFSKLQPKKSRVREFEVTGTSKFFNFDFIISLRISILQVPELSVESY